MRAQIALPLGKRPISEQVRFHPVMDLDSGDILGMATEEMAEFEERARFGPASKRLEPADPATWLADRLTRTACAAYDQDATGRPILVNAPIPALAHPNTALACDAAIRRTTMCQQEFCLMFPDAAFAADPADATSRIARLRRCGFRVGIDMRRSWQTGLSESLRIMIDTLRVDASAVHVSDDLHEAAIAAAASGILVVADGASWRDGPVLAESGISAAINPRGDA
ncbi:EAL domain-containing protein [Hyphomonas sp.]|uniref:EAL domain-containing protein n=1 Tax=Hyphomonas sp. TaxID=87 RepID=UPI003918884A